LLKTAELNPDLIVMDIELPGMGGIEVSRRLLTESPGRKIVVLSAYSNPSLIREALAVGVRAYLLKTNPTEQLIDAIQFAMAGKTYLCPEVASEMATVYKELVTAPSLPQRPQLSPREEQVLKLIAEGLRTKDIALRLNIGVKTVETHRAKLISKLGCSGSVDLAKYALRTGLASL
jgi:DNA-binding NarL/FixJ family response regulator